MLQKRRVFSWHSQTIMHNWLLIVAIFLFGYFTRDNNGYLINWQTNISRAVPMPSYMKCILQKTIITIIDFFLWDKSTWHIHNQETYVLPSRRHQCRIYKCDSKSIGGCPRGVMVKAMDCGIVVSEFLLQSRYYVHYRANTLGKGMDPLILSAMG